MRILVTGATGFVGREVVRRLSSNPAWSVRRSVRRPETGISSRAETIAVGDLAGHTDWSSALRDVDAVVHTAARVHMMREQADDPLVEYRRINTEATLSLARQAATIGVRRFVFLSSIKVLGEQTEPGHPFHADDPVAPCGPYAVSKYEAERGLGDIARETGLEVVVIRPVLVYGPGVKANFEAMMRVLLRRVPLPLGAIDNCRSLVAVQNLAGLIRTCLGHPAAANQTFLVSDGEDLSTRDLLRRLARVMRRPARLVPVPERVLLAAARIAGRYDLARRVIGSLQVDIEKTRQILGWSPELSVDDALAETVESFFLSRRAGA